MLKNSTAGKKMSSKDREGVEFGVYFLTFKPLSLSKGFSRKKVFFTQKNTQRKKTPLLSGYNPMGQAFLKFTPRG